MTNLYTDFSRAELAGAIRTLLADRKSISALLRRDATSDKLKALLREDLVDIDHRVAAMKAELASRTIETS